MGKKKNKKKGRSSMHDDGDFVSVTMTDTDGVSVKLTRRKKASTKSLSLSKKSRNRRGHGVKSTLRELTELMAQGCRLDGGVSAGGAQLRRLVATRAEGTAAAAGGDVRWARVRVIGGASHGPLTPLAASIAGELTAAEAVSRTVMWRVVGNNVEFYARLWRADVLALGLRTVHSTVDGCLWHLPLKAVLVAEPSVHDLTPEERSALAACLDRRYDSSTATLDLSALHRDDALHAAGCYAPLHRSAVLAAVTEALHSRARPLATVKRLTVAGNGLRYSAGLARLCERLGRAGVEALDVSNNGFKSVKHLDGFAALTGVRELAVRGNPFHGHNVSTNMGLLKVQFPNLTYVNGQPLPADTGLSIATSSNPGGGLPPVQPGHFPNEIVRSQVLSYIRAFIEVFDGAARSTALTPFYHDDVALRLTTNHGGGGCKPRPMNVVDDGGITPDDIYSHLHRGALHVVAALQRLPPTRHLLGSLRVDVVPTLPNVVRTLSTPDVGGGVLLVSMVGVFEELEVTANWDDDHDPPAVVGRSRRRCCFSRVWFLDMPAMRVRHELLTFAHELEPPNDVQSAANTAHFVPYSMTELQQALVSGPTQPANPAMTPRFQFFRPNSGALEARLAACSIGDPSAPLPNAGQREATLVADLASRTGMTSAYARQCLAEFEWDVQRSYDVFLTLRQTNAIPAKAFDS